MICSHCGILKEAVGGLVSVSAVQSIPQNASLMVIGLLYTFVLVFERIGST